MKSNMIDSFNYIDNRLESLKNDLFNKCDLKKINTDKLKSTLCELKMINHLLNEIIIIFDLAKNHTISNTLLLIEVSHEPLIKNYFDLSIKRMLTEDYVERRKLTWKTYVHKARNSSVDKHLVLSMNSNYLSSADKNLLYHCLSYIKSLKVSKQLSHQFEDMQHLGGIFLLFNWYPDSQKLSVDEIFFISNIKYKILHKKYKYVYIQCIHKSKNLRSSIKPTSFSSRNKAYELAKPLMVDIYKNTKITESDDVLDEDLRSDWPPDCPYVFKQSASLSDWQKCCEKSENLLLSSNSLPRQQSIVQIMSRIKRIYKEIKKVFLKTCNHSQ